MAVNTKKTAKNLILIQFKIFFISNELMDRYGHLDLVASPLYNITAFWGLKNFKWRFFCKIFHLYLIFKINYCSVVLLNLLKFSNINYKYK